MISEARPVRRRARRSRRLWLAAAAFVLLVLGGAAAMPVLSGRTESPRYTLESAMDALEGARNAGAARWAPDALGQAEAALRAARTEYRRQEIQFLLVRNFAAARSGLALAEERAREAMALARANAAEAEASAAESIDEADAALSRADALAASVHLDYPTRRKLQRSRVYLDEARALGRLHEPLRARERADASLRESAALQADAARLARRYTDPQSLRTWRRWVDETVAWSRQTGASAVVVDKEGHELHLYDGGRRVRTYRAEMGYNMFQAKLRSGDGATPEGRYRITARKGNGQSTYYKALLLNYPNEEDRVRFAKARAAGAIPRGSTPGGLIEIHGEGGQGRDWTRGCVALTNRDIDDLFARVAVGTPVVIVGGDGGGGIFSDLVKNHNAAAGKE